MEEDRDFYQEMLEEEGWENNDWAQVEEDSDDEMDDDQEEQVDKDMEQESDDRNSEERANPNPEFNFKDFKKKLKEEELAEVETWASSQIDPDEGKFRQKILCRSQLTFNV